jgi:hypothetical protein
VAEYDAEVRKPTPDMAAARDKRLRMLLAQRDMLETYIGVAEGTANACGFAVDGAERVRVAVDVVDGVAKFLKGDAPGLVLQAAQKAIEAVRREHRINDHLGGVLAILVKGLSELKASLPMTLALAAILSGGSTAVVAQVPVLAGYAGHLVLSFLNLKQAGNMNQASAVMQQMIQKSRRAQTALREIQQLLEQAAWSERTTLA